MKLFLFDIDGTLLKPKGVGKRAAERAFEKIYGIKNSMDEIKTHGLTDPIILLSMFNKFFKRDYTIDEANHFYSEYVDFLEDELEKKQSVEVLEGVIELLDHLFQREDCLLAVGTGNIEKGGWLKLEYSGLRSYFLFGGFGSDSGDRGEILKAAIEKGERNLNGKKNFDEIYVIGDTPNDIIYGRLAGAKTIAVATGIYSQQELFKYSADYLIKDLTHFLSLNL